MFRVPSLKIIKIVVWSMMFAVIAGLLVLVFSAGLYHQQKTGRRSTAAAESESGYRYARPAHRIKAFAYTHHIGGNKSISLQCSYLTVNRKKMRGIRLGLIKEAVLVNGLFQLYRYPRSNPLDKRDTIHDKQGSRDIHQTFLPKNIFPANFGNITNIVIHPIIFEIFTHNHLSTKITAQSAEFNLTRQHFRFTGNVHMVSGDREIKLKRMEFNPENEQLTGTDYILKTPDGTTFGKQIKTDLYLGKTDK